MSTPLPDQPRFDLILDSPSPGAPPPGPATTDHPPSTVAAVVGVLLILLICPLACYVTCVVGLRWVGSLSSSPWLTYLVVLASLVLSVGLAVLIGLTFLKGTIHAQYAQGLARWASRRRPG